MTPNVEVPTDVAVEAEAKSIPSSDKIETAEPSEVNIEMTTDKTLIRKRLIEAVKAAPVQLGRSTDLARLTGEYEENRKHLRLLHAAAKKYQQQLTALNEARIEFVDSMAKIAKDTPAYHAVGEIGEDSKSLLARAKMCAAATEVNNKKFQLNILDYIAEWDNLTSSRIDYEIKEAGKLRERRMHYEDKVDKIRKDIHKKEDKDGKEVKASQTEKLSRNEQKLKDSHEEHEEYCSRLCVLIEEASSKLGRWRDLVPVAQSYMEWETERCASEKLCLGTLEEAIEEMKVGVDKLGKISE